MAIKQDYDFKGIIVPMAYHRIHHANIIKVDGGYFLTFGIDISVDSTTLAIQSLDFACVYDTQSSNNTLVQCYNYLKSLDQFINAVDC